MSRIPGCTYHCATCNACFTSLRAFDAHHPSVPDPAGWDYPPCRDAAECGLVEREGVCRLGVPSDPGVLWELPGAREVAEAFRRRAPERQERLAA